MSAESSLLQELVSVSAERQPQAVALSHDGASLSYGDLQQVVLRAAGGLLELGLRRGERVAVYLEKRFEAVIAGFAAAAAGGVLVPVNPLLKPEQVGHILRDCGVAILVTSAERIALLESTLAACPTLRHVVVAGPADAAPSGGPITRHAWQALMQAPSRIGHRVIESDLAAIFYTSGSTGRPKGVVLSHRNLVAGAKSVAAYLGNGPGDRLLAVLPLSFDAGFSQLTTAFHAGARVVLLNYLFPRDVLRALTDEAITGLTAVPPLYIQLARTEWPAPPDLRLRYFASTGGRMPRETLDILRRRLPQAKPFLMYGLTEAFRSTYLPPEEVDRRPDSIGKAIPNVEVLVLRPDGSPCAANEPGELVHRGPLVAQGYWNDPERTAERFRLLPANCGREPALALPETAVFSGDTVRRDEEGFLYFIGRHDEMIKTSGYRVSPTEIEEIVYATGLVGECIAFGIADAALGQTVRVIATPPAGEHDVDTSRLLAECRARMPAYMVPAGIDVRTGTLPRNPNGKIDRQTLIGAPAA